MEICEGRGRCHPLCNDQLECKELCLGMDEELTKSLWVSITGRAGTADIIVEVCYRHPEKED